MAQVGKSVAAAGMFALLVLTLQLPLASATPDQSDSVTELRIDGPTQVSDGQTVVQTVQIDDDVPATPPVGADLAGGVRFTLVIPLLCENGTVSVQIPIVWAIRTSNVEKIDDTHEITVVAATNGQNVDTSNGRVVATITCVADVVGGQVIVETFRDVELSKFNPQDPANPISVPITGEPKVIVTVGPGGKGDINGDTFVDVLDVGLLVDFLAGRIPLTQDQQFSADVFPSRAETGGETCGDGEHDLNDLLTLIDLALARRSVIQQCFEI
jgi:hypothetical protein